MHLRLLTASILTGLLAVGCTPQGSKPMEKAMAKPKAAPELKMGASASMLANTCAGCHGTHGQSMGPATPTIAGMEADYLVETMQAYKNGDRVNTIMTRIAKGYTDAEIEQIADAFSQQKYMGVKQTSMGEKAKMGAKLHDKYCEKCHENGGTSVEDTPLAGQWMPYMHVTISDYLDGHNNPEKKMTKAIKKMIAEHPNMTKAQLAESLTNYYGSQQ